MPNTAVLQISASIVGAPRIHCSAKPPPTLSHWPRRASGCPDGEVKWDRRRDGCREGQTDNKLRGGQKVGGSSLLPPGNVTHH